MVLNLLQRFSLDEAKELILKSFGYFSSGSRLQPLLKVQEQIKNEVKAREFVCPYKLSDEKLHEYDKIRHIYVQNRQTYKKICKQERSKNRPLSPEAVKFGKETKAMLEKMHNFKCDTCKLYKKHSKNVEVLERFAIRLGKLDKELKSKEIFSGIKFLAHRSVLIDMDYLRDDYPTPRGMTTSQIRSENELFIAEIIFSNVLENLTPSQLAAVVCAITTEDLRIDIPYLPLSEPVRKTLNLIRNIRRKLEKVQSRYSLLKLLCI